MFLCLAMTNICASSRCRCFVFERLVKGLANRIAEHKYSHLFCVLRAHIQNIYSELGGVLEEDINVPAQDAVSHLL